jgi:hypothetical protein
MWKRNEIMAMRIQIVRTGHERAQTESVQELRELFAPWCSFPDNSGYKRLFTPSRTFWLFLFQTLTPNCSCQETLAKFLAWLKREKGKEASSKTTAYCKARLRLSGDDIQEVHRQVAQNIEAEAQDKHSWLGKRVRVIDGSSVSMPDTEANQARYPQPTSQKTGCGFPVMRIVGVFSLATGVLLDVAKSALNVHERTLFRSLWDGFAEDDIALADRGFAGFSDFHYLTEIGCDVVMRNHQNRGKGMAKLKRLGKNDRLVQWFKMRMSSRPKWLSKEAWQQMPDRLTVREITVTIDAPGFRSKSLIIVTTLLNSKDFPASEIAGLYRRRWAVEVYFRDQKTTMEMDVLRCKTPEIVDKELYMHLIAYNLVRAIMIEATLAYAINIERLSFKGCISTIQQWATTLVQAAPEERDEFYLAMLRCIVGNPVPDRPDRSEPRARKRRPKNYPLLNKPRREFVEIPHRSKYKKEES